MAIATTTALAGVSHGTSKSLFRKAMDSMVAARERQARRYVNGYLLSLDDATLAAYGYERAELERQGGLSAAF
ncbi:hypothetical protein [Stappia sp.]|jgi:hypothetical protein|uniref:hypothetical protein n=1 Tax=Stappia sp. TaxID=1870903 RepID=UPI003A9903C1